MWSKTSQQFILTNLLPSAIVQSMNKKGSIKKRYVIAISETLHYRLRQTALKDRVYLEKLVDRLLWDGLKAAK